MSRERMKRLFTGKYAKVIEPNWLYVSLYGILIFASATLLNWFVQLGYFLFETSATTEWLNEHWQLFLGSSFIIAFTMLLLLCLFRNLGLAVVIPSGLITLLGYTNYLALYTRGQWSPLHFSDLRLVSEAGTMATLITRRQLGVYGIILAVFIFFLFVSVFLAPRFKLSIYIRVMLGFCSFMVLYVTYSYAVNFQQTRNNVLLIIGVTTVLFVVLFFLKLIKRKQVVITAGILVGVLVITLALNQNPVRQFVAARSLYPDGHWAAGNFLSNGVVFAFIRSMSPKSLMEMPENFSVEMLEAIVLEYTQKAKSINQNRESFDDVQPNIIFIMNEAFSDPTIFENHITFNRDPIPYTRYIMQNNLSGKALVNVFAGGTIVPEFQALTGVFTQWFSTGSTHFYDYILLKESFPSIVSFLRNVGYDTTAIHAHGRSFYQRDAGFSIFGFDEFLARDNMKHTYLEGLWIADSAAYREVLDVIGDESGHFVFLITMQNHFPYPADLYPDIDIYASGDFDSDIIASTETHVRGLYASDNALSYLIDEIQSLEQPLVVLFFGDHLPATIPYGFFEANDYLREQFETPFFIYSNHLMLGEQELGTIGPMFFSYILLEAMNMQISPFHALQGELFQYVQAMHRDWYVDAYNEKRDKSEWDESILDIIDKLRIIQYDVVSGNQVSYRAGFFDIP